MSSPIRVAHVITSTDTGGAQTMLRKLLAHIDRSAFTSTVISLAPAGPMTEALQSVSIDMRPRAVELWKLARLRSLLRAAKPDVVQTWMYHANLAGGMASRLSVAAPVIWNIRASGFDWRAGHTAHVINPAVRLGALASRFVPKRTIYVSQRALASHEQLGYRGPNEIIPNGFDVAEYRPDPDARRSLRRELGLKDETLLVGLVARVHPIKNHALFLAAARAIAKQRQDVRFVLCGEGVTSLDAFEGVHALGSRSDMPRVTAALDIACSSSFAEGFPNTLGEAMACGVPCVATDVGDSAYLIGDTGLVVPSNDEAAFANACLRLLDDAGLRARLGRAARERIEQHFEIGVITKRYEHLYRSVA